MWTDAMVARTRNSAVETVDKMVAMMAVQRDILMAGTMVETTEI